MAEGLKLVDGLLIGVRELALLQSLMERARGRVGLAARRPGLVLGMRGGVLSDTWEVSDANDDGTITVAIDGGGLDDPGVAVALDADGVPFALGPGDLNTLEIPNDNTWYTLVCRAETTEYAEGTLTFAPPSTTVAGVNTRFGELNVAGTRNPLLLVEAADTSAGNDGTYDVSAVASDVSLTATPAAAAAESGVRFKLAGQNAIAGTTPGVMARRRAKLVLVSRTRQPQAGDVVLADVKRNDAGGPPKVQIIDRRLGSWSRPMSYGPPSRRAWVAEVRDTSGTLARVVQTVLTATAGATIRGLNLAPKRDGGWIALVNWNTSGPYNGRTSLIQYNALTETWGAAVVLSSGLLAGPTGFVLAMPDSYGDATHLWFTSAALTQVVVSASTDNGSTFGAGTTITSTITPVYGLITKSGRILVYGVIGTRLVYMFSDDYGTTWDTDGGAFYDVVGTGLYASVTMLGAVELDDGTIVTLFDGAGAGLAVLGVALDDPAPANPASTSEHFGVSGTSPQDVITDGDERLFSIHAQTDGVTVRAIERIAGANEWNPAREDRLFTAASATGKVRAFRHPRTGEVLVLYSVSNVVYATPIR